MDVIVSMLDELAAGGPAKVAAGGIVVVLVVLVVVDRTVARAIQARRRLTVRVGKRLVVELGDVVEAESPGPAGAGGSEGAAAGPPPGP